VAQYPDLNDPVVLRDQADREYASRVENLGERLVVVAQPKGLSADETYGSGTEISVTWSDADGVVMALPTRILAVHGDGSGLRWSLVVTGQATSEQRRRVERVDVTGPVALRAPDDDERATIPGSLIDASEKAIQFYVEAGSADRFMNRSDVVVTFALADAEFTIPGRVEFVRATKQPTRYEILVVLFDEPVTDVDLLRKHLYAQEAQQPATDDEQPPPPPSMP
jgi:hypothetical protein